MTTPFNPEPDDPTEQERLIASAIADFHDRQALGDVVDVEEFCRSHANIASHLRSELQATLQIDEMLLSPEVTKPSESTKSELPNTLSGHRILSEIGSGGMGRVLLARDERLKRNVAIKTLKPRYLNNKHLQDRFMREAQAMAVMQSHPNIVQIYEHGRPEEIPHFVMEYIEGRPLTETARALTLDQKAELMNKVVRAVAYLHENQLIHRDLKPGNILVGHDLQPKLLDFGLVRHVDAEGRRITIEGEIAGTPNYFSPEQTLGKTSLDARSDIFSLGAILYELLTGVVPFRSNSFDEQMRLIREEDPMLPRRRNSSVPGELQNICLKALEKDPADRYGSAREMAEDLDRFLAGEPVLANPSSYTRLMEGKIDQHIRELEGWRQDKILSEYEFDAFHRLYNRLVEREDAWILEARRLSMSQVTLYLGGWLIVVAAALVVLFSDTGLTRNRAVLVVASAMLPTLALGVYFWNRKYLRIGIAYLAAFCLLLPATLLVAMDEWNFLTEFTQNDKNLEFFSTVTSWHNYKTNAQMWWSLLLSLPIYFWLRRFTRASVFSLAFAVMSALLCLVTLSRMGAIIWFKDEILMGEIYLFLLPFAGMFFLAGIVIEKVKCPDDSRYFYPIAAILTFVALSGVAIFHKRYAGWLESTFLITRGQLEYLFIINAAIYFTLQRFCERLGTMQTRWMAKWFRFVVPGHILFSLWLLGMESYTLWKGNPDEGINPDPTLEFEAKFFEVLLPIVACFFVFAGIPKQMKNYFAYGVIFLAIGIVRLQRDLLQGKAVWPLSLLSLGLLLMIVAANYTPIKLTVIRIIRLLRRKS